MFLKAKESIHTYYCLAKISARRVLEDRPFEVVGAIFIAFISTFMLLQLHLKQKQERYINQYYLLICKILKEQVLLTWVSKNNFDFFLERSASLRP